MINKYQQFIMYIIVAGFSFTIDILLFAFFKALLNNSIGDISIIISTVIARVISSFINYLLNRNTVFKSNCHTLYDTNTLFKYYLLVIIQLSISAISVYLIHAMTNIDATIIKIPVDSIIFVINYLIQKHYIFKGSDNYAK